MNAELRGTDRRTRRGVVFLVIGTLAILAAGPAGAQTPASEGSELPRPVLTGTLRIRSEPSGALVTLTGEHRWRGTTPWDLDRGLRGRYEIVAELDGYERWQRTIQLEGGEIRTLDIELSPKQAWKAAVRSLAIPGWGQYYADRPRKGTSLLLGTAGAVAGLWWTDEEYQDQIDDYRRARDAYLTTDNLEDLDEARGAMERSERRADRAYNRRKIFLYATGGLYALSFIDALFFFPSRAQGSFASISPWGEEGPRLAMEGSGDGAVRLTVAWDGLQGGER